MNSIKIPQTQYPVLDIIKNRWSARAFADKEISDDALNTLFEAASWAASANNEQPWEYLYSKKGEEGYEKILATLMPGNQPWAKNAGAFIITSARRSFKVSQKENAWAHHDLGMANAHLLLQATALDLYCHPMAGFHKVQLIESLGLSGNQDPICVIAIGYLTEADTLEEPYKTRELTARTRNALDTFVFKV
ncbi:MAG: nitroreductase family protein [Chitinophagales bacterium]|nr:nitroreductase family protein [Chitinophagales bacterium]